MILFVLVFGLLALFATQFLWNALVVSLFGLPAISLLQTAGLMLLGRLLTGGFGRRGGNWRHRGGPWMGGGGPNGFQEMREKWQSMSWAERQELKAKWREKGCRSAQKTAATEPGQADEA